MNTNVEQALMSKIRALTPQQVAEVEDFVEFLAAKSNKRAALDRRWPSHRLWKPLASRP